MIHRKRRSSGRILLVAGLLGLFVAQCADDPEQRIRSIYELKRVPTEDGLREIRGMLGDPDRDVRATALNALVGLRVSDSLGLVVVALDDEDAFVRATAAKLAGDLRDRSTVEQLVGMLTRDDHPVARQRAAEALAELGGDRAVGGLVEGLADPMQQVRLAAVRGLRELDSGAGRAALVRLVLEDPDWEIRVQAARTLGQTGDPEVLPALERALRDENEMVRGAASNALEIHREVRERAGADAVAKG